MDTTTKKWMLVPTALTLALTLIALGFAAMSTNPSFAIPSWLPFTFFVMAGMIVVLIFVYLVRSRSDEVKAKKRRKAVADNLGLLYLSGEEIKDKFKFHDFEDNPVFLANEWSESVKKYFLDNPRELGVTRLLLLRPRQADWFVYSQFDPLGQGIDENDRTYAFRHVSIELEKLLDLIGEFLQ